jgi:hypothetical protein
LRQAYNYWQDQPGSSLFPSAEADTVFFRGASLPLFLALDPKVGTLHPLLKAAARQGSFSSWVKPSSAILLPYRMPFRISFLEEPPRSLSRGPLFLPHRLFAHLFGKSVGFEREFCGGFTQGRCETNQRYNHIPLSKLDFEHFGSRVSAMRCSLAQRPLAFAVLTAQYPTPPRAPQFPCDPRAPRSGERKRVQRWFITKDDPSPKNDPAAEGTHNVSQTHPRA